MNSRVILKLFIDNPKAYFAADKPVFEIGKLYPSPLSVPTRRGSGCWMERHSRHRKKIADKLNQSTRHKHYVLLSNFKNQASFEGSKGKENQVQISADGAIYTLNTLRQIDLGQTDSAQLSACLLRSTSLTLKTAYLPISICPSEKNLEIRLFLLRYFAQKPLYKLFWPTKPTSSRSLCGVWTQNEALSPSNYFITRQ